VNGIYVMISDWCADEEDVMENGEGSGDDGWRRKKEVLAMISMARTTKFRRVKVDVIVL
jgi:hypothetical protein